MGSEFRDYVFTESLEGGEIFDALNLQERKTYSEALLAGYIKQVLEGLEYLHSKKIIHRNINLHTIVFAEKDCKTIKLTEFAAEEANGKEIDRVFMLISNPIFHAPEILNKLEYDEACDIWSLGIVCYIIFSGTFPFSLEPSDSYLTVSKKIMKKVISKEDFTDPGWDDVSDDAKDFLMEMLQKDPKKRANATELLNNRWIKKASTELKNLQSAERVLKTLAAANVSNQY